MSSPSVSTHRLRAAISTPISISGRAPSPPASTASSSASIISALAYSPSPNLLIANLALRTKKIRLGVMGVVPPYHSPWQLVEEIGMLDHLTGGRLEIGTAAGIPQEMAHDRAWRRRGARPQRRGARDHSTKALPSPVISHHGKFWNFDNLRLDPAAAFSSRTRRNG